MLQMRDIRETLSPAEPAETPFGPLRAIAAQLLLVAGAQSTFAALSGRRLPSSRRPVDFPRPASRPVDQIAVWAPAVLAPLAAAAHLAHIVRPSENSSRNGRFLDAAVVGVGVASALVELLTVRESRTPPIAPLALASTGLLGLLIDRQEEEAEDERRQLEKRASLTERLVPRRRPKLDRIVVHV